MEETKKTLPEYDDKGKLLDLSGKALRKADLLERKKLKKAGKEIPFNPLYDGERKETKGVKKSVSTLKELLAKAKELGLKGYSKLNKTELGERISEVEEESSKEKE